MNKVTACKVLCICNLLFVQVDRDRTAIPEFELYVLTWLACISQVVNGQAVAVGTSQKTERLKPLFNSTAACLWIFGFQGGKCQETQSWKEATEFACLGISAPNVCISCLLCFRDGNENTHILLF